MHYTITMSASFESEKNRKAFFYTIAIVIAFLLLAIFWTWIIPPPPAPIAQDLIEVNLGNLSEGFGEVQPLIKGEKSPAEEPANEPKQTQAAAAPEPVKEQMPDDSKDADAIPVVKPTKTVTKTKPVTNTVPVVVAEPKPRKPKITYPDGVRNPNPGNNATEGNDTYTQGNNPKGTGDAGHPNGKPDSYGNNPGGKTGGASVTKGVRPYNLGDLRFQDDFNENAKVYVDIRYNAAGTFVSSTVSRGTTTSNAKILSIARQKVSALKFPPSPDGGITTILLNFKVQ
ncbi:hypothetical protein [Ferruginibacter sp. SUN106]|uniref:hypothetical protein n=1 Tax=Ferruginibacter sp. SUN106 TaxID=2978348 RepID=UPI003D35A7AB